MLKQRKTNRLKGYDYLQNGTYFITICTKNRECLFGDITDSKMILSEIGNIVYNEIICVPLHYYRISIPAYCIMPNHLHMIVAITTEERINPFPTGDIPNVVGKFKAGVSRRVGNALMRSTSVWQRSYHDHIIRNEQEYQSIWQYVDNNPLQWELDCHNPKSEKYRDWNKENEI